MGACSSSAAGPGEEAQDVAGRLGVSDKGARAAARLYRKAGKVAAKQGLPGPTIGTLADALDYGSVLHVALMFGARPGAAGRGSGGGGGGGAEAEAAEADRAAALALSNTAVSEAQFVEAAARVSALDDTDLEHFCYDAVLLSIPPPSRRKLRSKKRTSAMASGTSPRSPTRRLVSSGAVVLQCDVVEHVRAFHSANKLGTPALLQDLLSGPQDEVVTRQRMAELSRKHLCLYYNGTRLRSHVRELLDGEAGWRRRLKLGERMPLPAGPLAGQVRVPKPEKGGNSSARQSPRTPDAPPSPLPSPALVAALASADARPNGAAGGGLAPPEPASEPSARRARRSRTSGRVRSGAWVASVGGGAADGAAGGGERPDQDGAAAGETRAARRARRAARRSIRRARTSSPGTDTVSAAAGHDSATDSTARSSGRSSDPPSSRKSLRAPRAPRSGESKRLSRAKRRSKVHPLPET